MADHLCVLIHGLWGNPSHLEQLRSTLQAQHEGLHILVAKSNTDSYTYDGIALGGERITNEIEQQLADLSSTTTITKISIVGYSLGGLIARYAIGLLYKNGVFDDIEPVNFTTFATPHLGVRTPTVGWKGDFWNSLGSRTLSTSGQQMFLIDDFRETGRPLLGIMADANSAFIKGLAKFKSKSVYANIINDRSVPFYTSGISATDPFVDLERVNLNYDKTTEPDPDGKLVILESEKPATPKPDALVQTWGQTLSQTASNVPLYALLTVLVPIGATVFLINSGYQTYQSARRVRLHEEGKAGISLGRYRIPLLEEATQMRDRVYSQLAESEREDYLPTPPPETSTGSSSAASTNNDVEKAVAGPPSVTAAVAEHHRKISKDEQGFPKLALTDEQFKMIANLDKVGLRKFPVHIRKVRHTHAAIIVRTKRETFSEGWVVINHWAERFEV
ncbi:hypothetical protein MBLNU230_g7100t1 [Neophaeotheca triangularis]